MTTWGRLEFLPDLLGLRHRWITARIRRRQEREARIEWASRDGIFFAAVVANAHLAWFLVVIATVVSTSTFVAGLTLATDSGRFKIPLFALASFSGLWNLGYLWWAFRCEREWRAAATRRGARAKPTERML